MEITLVYLSIASNLVVIFGGLAGLAAWAYQKKLRGDKLDALYEQLVPSNGRKCIMDRMDDVESTLRKQDHVLDGHTQRLGSIELLLNKKVAPQPIS